MSGTGGRKAARGLVLYAMVLTIGVGMAAPFLWMLSSSFKPMSEIFAYPPTVLPQEPTLENYLNAFSQAPVLRWLLNSAIVSGTIILANLFTSSMAAYAFARIEFPGRDVVFYVLIATLMIPFHLTLVPLFLVLKTLGLVNSLAGVIAPGLASVLGVFLLRGFFRAIPVELEDAARVDGASELQLYWRIAMPLAQPALATLGIITLVHSWGEFLLPLLVLNSPSQYTLPLGLATFQNEYATQWGQIMAVTTVADIPILVLFVALQRHFIEGLTQGAVKG